MLPDLPAHSNNKQALRSAIPAAAVSFVFTIALVVIFDLEEGALHPLILAFLVPSLIAGFLVGRLWIVAWALVCFLGFALIHGSPPAWSITVPGLLVGTLLGVLLSRFLSPPVVAGQQATDSGVRRRQRTAPQALRSVLNRQRVDNAIDQIRFRIDRFPHGVYQPVPSLPVRFATRADGCESRWAEMLPVIERLDVRSAVDIGANVGFFSLSLGAAGIPTVAVDQDPRVHRTALLALRRSGIEDVGILYFALTPENVNLLPVADCVVYLSVWHHIVRWHGMEKASAMLQTIWSRAGKVMFFDTGENEMDESFGLPPMTPDAETWLTDYLLRTCEGSRIQQIGSHAAFDAEGNPCTRNLFAVIRN